MSKKFLENDTKKFTGKHAFSLIELSIVLVIMGFILSGSLSAIQIGIKKAEIKTTNKNLEESYNAIGSFLRTNKRLPCPSPIRLTQDSDNFGLESRSANGCTGNGIYSSGRVVYGMVPTRSLGISDAYGIDGYGNKIAYIVDERLTTNYITNPDPDLESSESFGTLSDQQNISISQISPSGIRRVLHNDVAIVLISYGENMYGAFPSDQSSQRERSVNDVEKDNDICSTCGSATNFDSNFVFRDMSSSATIDDVVIFKRRSQLVTEFSIKNIIACSGNILDSTYPGVFPKTSIYYGNSVTANSPCPNPFQEQSATIKCGEYGKWNSPTLCPPSNTNSCIFPSSSDEVKKLKVVLNTNYSLQGYSFVKSGTTFYIWNFINPGTILQNSAVRSANIATPVSVNVEATCNNGLIAVKWT